MIRLLSLDEERDEPCLTEFPEDDLAAKLPPYAVLSHTWGADADEVTHRDITEHTGRGKAGYHKIRFCADRAAKDGLRYFWVDTCCIDKADSSEVMTAINSMFRWYRASHKCYVYLPDVPGPTEGPTAWQAAFDQSRWFTRGWTLQELLAPSTVEFFSRDGAMLGDKVSLEAQICHITGIPPAALRGYELSTISSNEIFGWALGRSTKRPEDRAYCLFGIFDVVLPTAYGEGEAKALRRLQQQVAEDAAYNDRELLLLRSAKQDKLQAVEALVAAGVKTDAIDSRGETALIYASRAGNLAMVKALCQGDALRSTLNHQDIDGYTALMRAAEGGRLEIVRELLQQRPQLHLRDGAHQQHALFHALANAVGDPEDDEGSADPRWAIATALMEADTHAVLEEPPDGQALPLLHWFCKMGRPSAVKWMLKWRPAHFDPNTRRAGPEGRTPLLECTAPASPEAAAGATRAMQLLLDAGADPALSLKRPGGPGDEGVTGPSALIEACAHDYPAQVALLLAAGADVHYQPTNGWSALQMAANQAQLEILEQLLRAAGGGRAARALTTARDANDHTSLHRACMPFIHRYGRPAPPDTLAHGAPACVQVLLDAGAPTEAYHWAGWTPLMEAASRGHTEVVRVLLRAGADPDAQNPVRAEKWLGWTALMYATCQANPLPHDNSGDSRWVETCRVLVEEGRADLSIRNAEGRTAAQMARSKDVRKYLEVRSHVCTGFTTARVGLWAKISSHEEASSRPQNSASTYEELPVRT